MNESPEPSKSELEDRVFKFDELLCLLQTDKERFAQLAKTFNADDAIQDALKKFRHRHKNAGKQLTAARKEWEALKQTKYGTRQSFPDYFESRFGCRPSNEGQSCAKTYRVMVLTGKITESDYDVNPTEAIRDASRIIFRVNNDATHHAVTEAALILKRRVKYAMREMRALLDRLVKDPATGKIKLLNEVEAAELNKPPIDYASGKKLASSIAEAGHWYVMAGALEEEAAKTPDWQEARSIARALAKIRAGLASNLDEHGQRRFSDEAISAWMMPDAPVRDITPESLKADYATAKGRIQEIEIKLTEAGIPPPQPSAFSVPVGQVISFKASRAAEQRVLELIRKRGWKAKDVSGENIGYDIEARTPEGKEICVEVKSLVGSNLAFTLTSNEEAVAREKGESYQLALVRQTQSCLEVAFIADPIRQLKLTRQCRKWVWECTDYDFRPVQYQLE